MDVSRSGRARAADQADHLTLLDPVADLDPDRPLLHVEHAADFAIAVIDDDTVAPDGPLGVLELEVLARWHQVGYVVPSETTTPSPGATNSRPKVVCDWSPSPGLARSRFSPSPTKS